MPCGELIATGRPLDDAQRALHGWFTLRVGPLGSATRTYYDTFDGLLHEDGLTLSAVNGVRTLSSRDGSPLRPIQTAKEVAGVRALLPIAQVEVSEQLLEVLDEREKTVCRIALESPVGLRARARLIGLRGYQRELTRVTELLVSVGGFSPAVLPLVDEAVLAAGGNPQGASTKVEVGLRKGERADRAVARVLLRLLEVMDTNFSGTLAGTDTEFLHDYRVAIRRTRTVIRELRGVFPAEDLERLREDFKWLQDVTSQTRDLEVYLLEFENLRELAPQQLRDDFEPVLEVLRAWHFVARQHMERNLSDERARRIHNEWAGLLAALPGIAVEERPDATCPIEVLVGKRIRRVHRRMVRMGTMITIDSPPEEFHELRKKGKELRYLLELFAMPLFPADVVRPMVHVLKGLQDVLGRHQDREVQMAMLRRLGDHVLARPGGVAALIATGALVERLEADAHDARKQFAASFEEFASDAQCKLVRNTFKSSKT